MTNEQKAKQLITDLGQQNNNWFKDFLESITHERKENVTQTDTRRPKSLLEDNQ